MSLNNANPNNRVRQILFTSIFSLFLHSGCGNVESIDTSIGQMNKTIEKLQKNIDDLEKTSSNLDKSFKSISDQASFLFNVVLKDLEDSPDAHDNNGFNNIRENALLRGIDPSLLPKVMTRDCSASRAKEVRDAMVDYAGYKDVDNSLEEVYQIPGTRKEFKIRRIDMITSDIQKSNKDLTEAFVWVVLKPYRLSIKNKEHVKVFPRAMLKCTYSWLKGESTFAHTCLMVPDPKKKRIPFALTSFLSNLTVKEDSSFCKKKNPLKTTEIRYSIDFEISNEETSKVREAVLNTFRLKFLYKPLVELLFTNERFVKWYFEKVFPLWLKTAE